MMLTDISVDSDFERYQVIQMSIFEPWTKICKINSFITLYIKL